MSLPDLKLDDRDWDDLVEEAKRRIAAKCPNWTDFNPSDPGMTLVELMAWMTDTALYRLNRVPEKNYIKFLELIGLRLRPARPARTWVSFTVQDKANEDALRLVPEGTRISTRPQRDDKPVTFSTVQNLDLTSAKIIKTCSRYGRAPNEFTEEHRLSGENPWESEIFCRPKTDLLRGQAVPHILYLGDKVLSDPLLLRFSKETSLRVLVELERTMKGSLYLEWEAWDGQVWRTVVPDQDTTEGFQKPSGAVLFERLPSMKEVELRVLSRGQLTGPPPVAGEAGARWLRARIIGTTVEQITEEQLPVIRSVRRQMDLKECVVLPQKAFAEMPPLPPPTNANPPLRPTVVPLQPLELNADFCPFGPRVDRGCAFYLASELFQKRGATIAIQFAVRTGLRPQSSDTLEVHWEYKHERGEWRTLGQITPGVPIRTEPGFALQDDTQAFTRSGKVEFRCPDDIAQSELAGQAGWFVRARVERATFGTEDDARLTVSSALLQYRNEKGTWAYCVSENYSEFKAHPATEPPTPFTPFRFEASQDPAFYLCLAKHPDPARGPYRLFLDVVPQEIEPWEPEIPRASDEEQRWLRRTTGTAVVKPRGATMVWEYRKGPNSWEELKVAADGTQGFTHEGTVDFFSPEDWPKGLEFDKEGWWLRVRWVIAEFLRAPRLRRVLLNTAEAEQTISQPLPLGSSTGTPNQVFSLRTSILDLDRPEIWICESGKKSGTEVAEFKEKNDGAEVENLPNGFWVRWTKVWNFFRSKATDRHFTADLEEGKFTFGDDRHGMIPPKGDSNVEVWSRETLGSAGNVGINTITVMEMNLENVQSVKNIYPAEGGSDPEKIGEACQRGSWAIKHGNRAVTKEDFVELAKEASVQVGKVECYEHGGVVHLIVVPNDKGKRPQPSRRLIQDVEKDLEGKKMINTRIKVAGPTYETIELEVEVVLDSQLLGPFEEVRDKIKNKLQDFVHPLSGMDDGQGWPMGRTVHKSELYYLLETTKGVEHVGNLRMRKSKTHPWEDNIRIGERSFPWFSDEMKISRVFD